MSRAPRRIGTPERPEPPAPPPSPRSPPESPGGLPVAGHYEAHCPLSPQAPIPRSRCRLRLPLGLLYGVATLSERVYRLFRLDGEPPFTRYTICTLGYSQTLNIEKAERELGYRPMISLSAGIRKYAKGER